MAGIKIAVIVPTYGQFPYARRTIISLFQHSSESVAAILVDDCSPNYHEFNWKSLDSRVPAGKFHRQHFSRQSGLTRSWNWGLRRARDLGADYVVTGNSDILFTAGWEAGLLHAVDKQGFGLVGPVSNAPGSTCPHIQDVAMHYPSYHLTDNTEYLRKVADHLRNHKVNKVKETNINGFFMLAKTSVWWENSFDKYNVFNPGVKFRMVGNEDELQTRWRRKGIKFGVVLSSFIFHYRSVTRGNGSKRGRWYRCKDPMKI